MQNFHSHDLVQQFLVSNQDDPYALADFARSSARETFRGAAVRHYAELMVIPVLDDPNLPVIGKADVWAQAKTALLPTIRRALPPGCELRIFDAIFPMEDLCAMPRHLLQEHLASMRPDRPHAKRSTPIAFDRPSCHFELGTPRLGFILAYARSRLGWPSEAPIPSNDCSFARKSASERLGLAAWESPMQSPPQSLAFPTLLSARSFAEGMKEGLCAWLEALARYSARFRVRNDDIDRRNAPKVGRDNEQTTGHPGAYDLCQSELQINHSFDLILHAEDIDLLTIVLSQNQPAGDEQIHVQTAKVAVRRYMLSGQQWHEVMDTLHSIARREISFCTLT